MTEPKPKYETRGRPKNGDYPEKVFARISKEHRDYVNERNAAGESDSEYIRRLIDADMQNQNG